MPGVTAFPSQANFVLARVPDAMKVFEQLRQWGILIKSMDGMHPLLANCVRFTVGTPEENTLLITSLEKLFDSPGRGASMSNRVA
jgi:histidinol-phosphate aminotransferase